MSLIKIVIALGVIIVFLPPTVVSTYGTLSSILSAQSPLEIPDTTLLGFAEVLGFIRHFTAFKL